VVIFQFGCSFIRVGISGDSRPRHVLDINELFSKFSGLSESNFEYVINHNSHFQIAKFQNFNSQLEGYLMPVISKIYTHYLQIKPDLHHVVIIVSPYQPTYFLRTLHKVFSRLKVTGIKLLENGTITSIPASLGMTHGIIIDIGRFESRVGCVYQYANNEYHVLMGDTLNIVPCGYISFVGLFIRYWNSFTENETKSDDNDNVQNVQLYQIEDGIAVVQECLSNSGRDSIISVFLPYQKKTIKINSDVVNNCLNHVFFDVSNRNSLIYAFLQSLLSCPIDLRRKMAGNTIFTGGGLIPLSTCNFEKKFLKCIENLFQNEEALDSSCSSFKCLSPLLNPSSSKGSLGILSSIPFEASSLSWIGASVMCSSMINSKHSNFTFTEPESEF